jgi:hypothetical protein
LCTKAPCEAAIRKQPGRERHAVAALRRERDELAERLAQIEAFQPGIADKARAWIAQVDSVPGVADAGGKRWSAESDVHNWPDVIDPKR